MLETGICSPPYQILAISLKRDAARNLDDRVAKRCAVDAARRFTSLTFDAFCKGLVDRFLTAIPPSWRPDPHYSVAFPKDVQIKEFLDRVRRDAPAPWQPTIARIHIASFESRIIGRSKLPTSLVRPTTAREFVVQRWWKEYLGGSGGSSLTFVMINRLSELLLRTNAHIGRAVKATYPFLLVDEFQDTTFAQYDLLCTAFHSTRTVVTVVGDDKQRIMGWAGALSDSFTRFQRDFAAERVQLLLNFRSSPALVRIQHVLAKALDANVQPAQAMVESKVDGDVAQVWMFPSESLELEVTADWIARDMHQRGLAANDYAILVRQKADEFAAKLEGGLATRGLRLSNLNRMVGRATVQDLLADELTIIAVAILRLGANRSAAESWEVAAKAVDLLRVGSLENDWASTEADAELTVFLRRLRASMAAKSPPTASDALEMATMVFEFLDMVAVARTYVQYSAGDALAIVVESFKAHLAASAVGATSWNDCLDSFGGVNQVPLMTVHKSKGLQYDTVIFVGLEDTSWWSHTSENPEGKATFFVAFSRAKQRAIFTFCEARGRRERVADLYRLLSDAGVPERRFGE